MTDTSSTDVFDPQLIAWRLGDLDPEAAERFAAQLQEDPELQRQDEALSQVLAALHAERKTTPQPKPDLLERVTARVETMKHIPRVAPAPAAEPADDERRPRLLIHPHSLRQIIAVAAVIVLAVGLGIPTLVQVRDRASRVACSANLATLGRGLSAYANSFNNHVPFTGWNQASTWRATEDAGWQVVHNRRHLYPLVRREFVAPTVLICPSSENAPMTASQIRNHDNFLEARNVSYAYQNMAGVRPRLDLHPELPILSDDNPLFDNGVPLFDAVRARFQDPKLANSSSHRGSGQNLLTLDGAVKWFVTPQAGIEQDNIWTLQHVSEYTGREGPSVASDAHLIK